jgi:antitoxin PrlF
MDMKTKDIESQAYFWTKEWQEAEKEASEDIKAGRIKTFDTAEELLADLDNE